MGVGWWGHDNRREKDGVADRLRLSKAVHVLISTCDRSAGAGGLEGWSQRTCGDRHTGQRSRTRGQRKRVASLGEGQRTDS